MMSESGNIVTPWETEAYVESLECVNIEDVGSAKWMTLHERLESLNMQAVLEAQGQKEEYVKDLFISRDKVSFLVKELILTEVWRDMIFPEILQTDEKPKTSIGIYIVLHHEVTVLTLLEVISFRLRSSPSSDSALECVGDLVLDLIDYCYRALVHLLGHPHIQLEHEALDEPSTETTLRRQRDDFRFVEAMQAVALLQYICEELSQLTVSAASRLLRQHDLPLLLVQLLDERPWRRTSAAGRPQKYDGRSWVASPRDDLAVAKVEGQVWLTLVHVLMNREHLSLYEISEYRRSQLVRLQTHLTDALLDQVPPLVPLRQWVVHLSLSAAPPPRTSVIIETVPEARETLLARHAGNWAKLARLQLEKHFSADQAAMQGQARRLAALYDLDKLAPLLSEPTKCGSCGDAATKKCSQCKSVWYCGRKCQVQHWPQHKPHCHQD